MTTTRRIGLSLGADECWPICFEDILKRWNPTLKIGGESINFAVDRVDIEPFDLKKPVRFDVVVDRLTHWYANTREWIKKAVILNDLYVFNNPWTVQSMEKQTSYCAMMKLGMPVPDTWLVPPKEYDQVPDLEPTLQRYAKFFDLDEIGRKLGYPVFMKPYDGGGWVGVTKVDNKEELNAAYEVSGKYIMHLQKGVIPYTNFVRCIGLGPQTRIIEYNPTAPLHARYTDDFNHLPEADLETLRATTLVINAFFGWDFNSCECLAKDGIWYPIDFANPCPDSQVSSLHKHFPWLVLAKMRWAIFCAATKRRFRNNLDWDSYFKIAASKAAYPEKLKRYAKLARKSLQADEFEAFCAEHMSQLDEVAWEYFGTDAAKAAVRKKVVALFPAHEHDEFTDHFWATIQTWRETEGALA